MKGSLLLILLACLSLFSSCTAPEPKPSDAAADTELGLTHEEDRGEAEQTLEELREAQQQEQRRRLERQVTEPEPIVRASET